MLRGDRNIPVFFSGAQWYGQWYGRLVQPACVGLTQPRLHDFKAVQSWFACGDDVVLLDDRSYGVNADGHEGGEVQGPVGPDGTQGDVADRFEQNLPVEFPGRTPPRHRNRFWTAPQGRHAA